MTKKPYKKFWNDVEKMTQTDDQIIKFLYFKLPQICIKT